MNVFSRAILFYLLVATALANHLAIGFHRWLTPDCGVKQWGPRDKLRNNNCKTWSETTGFFSFKYTKWNAHKNLPIHNAPDCNIAVYSKPRCQGKMYLIDDTGSFPTTTGKCGGKAYGMPFEAFSVGVLCSPAHCFKGNWAPALRWDKADEQLSRALPHNATLEGPETYDCGLWGGTGWAQ